MFCLFKSTAVQLQIHRLVSCLEMVVSKYMQYNYNKKIAVFVKFSVFRTVGYILSCCIIFFDCTNKTVQLLIHVHVNYTGNK